MVSTLAAALLSGCSITPPQIASVLPVRGSVNVPTSRPIRISFTSAVYHESVEQRFHIMPSVQGHFVWRRHALYFYHPPLMTDHVYTITLDPGYSGPGELPEPFTHQWSFTTQPAPKLLSFSPAQQGGPVHLSAQMAFSFSRPMKLASLRQALTILPPFDYWLTLAPGNPDQVLLTPTQLLIPNTRYFVTISGQAQDRNGNRLGPSHTYTVLTGAPTPLSNVVSFLVGPGSAGEQLATPGLWEVDATGLPRLLTPGTIESYFWNSSGSEILLEYPGQRWAILLPGQGPPQGLPFRATWAHWLPPAGAAALRLIYLEGGSLYLYSPPAPARLLSADVFQVPAVSAYGQLLAVATPSPLPTEISLINLDELAVVKQIPVVHQVTDLAWSANHLFLAYSQSLGPTPTTSLEVASVTGVPTVTQLAMGTLGSFRWEPSGTELVLAQIIGSSTHPTSRCWVVNVQAPVPPTATTSLPRQSPISCTDPQPSPDGHQIAFLSTNGQGFVIPWLMNSDGSHPQQLLPNFVSAGLSASDLAWAP